MTTGRNENPLRGNSPQKGLSAYQEAMDKFHQFMDNDLDTPKATALMFRLMKETNKHLDRSASEKGLAHEKAKAAIEIAKVLGLLQGDATEEIVDLTTQQLIEQRDKARATKDWATSDELRDAIQALGWVVEDTPEGTKVHR
jgi:cysteinyl-tRNA synthetase